MPYRDPAAATARARTYWATTGEQHRAKRRMKYASDAETRAMRRSENLSYHTEHAGETNRRNRERYATDPAYRAHRLAINRKSYRKSKERA